MRPRWPLIAAGLLIASQACGSVPQFETEGIITASESPLAPLWTQPPTDEQSREPCNPGSRIIALISRQKNPYPAPRGNAIKAQRTPCPAQITAPYP